MFAQWPGDRLNFSIFKPLKFRFAGQRAASEAGHITNTHVSCNPTQRHIRHHDKRKNHQFN